MHPTSTGQFEAAEGAAIPAFEQVRDDVWALGLAMDGDHIPCSFLYLLRDADGFVHVIDPGTDSDENFAALVAALAAIDATPADIRSITVTHLHPDHIGMADRLRAESGAPVQLSALEAAAIDRIDGAPVTESAITALARSWGVPAERRAELLDAARRAPATAGPAIDRTLVDGEELGIPGFTLTAVLTPGHTPGHLCLRDATRSLVFSGDHILPTMFAGLGLGGPTSSNALADYVSSADRIAEFDDHEVLPGHGYRFTGLRERARESAGHHLKRTAEVEQVLASDPDASVYEIASNLTWTAGFANLTGFFLFSALSQTEMHRAYVRRH